MSEEWILREPAPTPIDQFLRFAFGAVLRIISFQMRQLDADLPPAAVRMAKARHKLTQITHKKIDSDITSTKVTIHKIMTW